MSEQAAKKIVEEPKAGQPEVEEKSGPTNAPSVRFDTSQIQSSYANVCTVTSTREEVVLNFGINQAWERNREAVDIQLTNRIILSPFAARRMADGLNKMLAEYETRHGPLTGIKG